MWAEIKNLGWSQKLYDRRIAKTKKVSIKAHQGFEELNAWKYWFEGLRNQQAYQIIKGLEARISK